MYNRVYYTLRKAMFNKNKLKMQKIGSNNNKIYKRKFSTYSGNQNQPDNDPENFWICLFAGLSIYFLNKRH